jgi:hypothetical protein
MTVSLVGQPVSAWQLPAHVQSKAAAQRTAGFRKPKIFTDRLELKADRDIAYAAFAIVWKSGRQFWGMSTKRARGIREGLHDVWRLPVHALRERIVQSQP